MYFVSFEPFFYLPLWGLKVWNSTAMGSASTLPLKMFSSVSRGSGFLIGSPPEESGHLALFLKATETHHGYGSHRPSTPCCLDGSQKARAAPSKRGHNQPTCVFTKAFMRGIHRGKQTQSFPTKQRIQVNQEWELGTVWEMEGNRNSIFRMCVFWNLFPFNAEHKIRDFTNAFRDKHVQMKI